MFIGLDEGMFVAGQIAPVDVAEASRLGVRLIINNRPDGEERGQPDGASIARAATAAGIAYRLIPVDHAGVGADQVAAMAEALAGADGPVLAFCRSGTRSTFLWALARHTQGESGADLLRKAASAGYDLAPLRHVLNA